MTHQGVSTLVVAGVSGSGKSTIAHELGQALGWVYAEGDSFHPTENLQKMAAGHALDDADRAPWLRALAAWIDENHAEGRGCAVSCSALRTSYRATLARPWLAFCMLEVPVPVLRERLENRPGHFMPASLLGSQLATLEPLGPGEAGFTLDAARPVADVLLECLAVMRAMASMGCPRV